MARGKEAIAAARRNQQETAIEAGRTYRELADAKRRIIELQRRIEEQEALKTEIGRLQTQLRQRTSAQLEKANAANAELREQLKAQTERAETWHRRFGKMFEVAIDTPFYETDFSRVEDLAARAGVETFMLLENNVQKKLVKRYGAEAVMKLQQARGVRSR